MFFIIFFTKEIMSLDQNKELGLMKTETIVVGIEVVFSVTYADLCLILGFYMKLPSYIELDISVLQLFQEINLKDQSCSN